MAEDTLTMFGKTYNTVGSADGNLLLQTRGDIKIRWGNKFIDLIKNGKINVDSEFLFEASSKDEIVKDGIYIIESEENQEVWVKYKNTLVNLLGEINDNYVAFVKDQEVKYEDKFRALKNIGFYQDSQEAVKEQEFKEGIVYILSEHQLYYFNDGQLTKYEQKFEIPDPLQLGELLLEGESGTISSSGNMTLTANGKTYITLGNHVQVDSDINVDGNILSNGYAHNSSGYGLYMSNGVATLEADVIIVRDKIIMQNTIDITYDELKSLIAANNLTVGKTYRITDFFNEWDTYQYHITNADGTTNDKQFYFPVCVTAETSSSLSKEGYFCDNKRWIIEYDVNFNYVISDGEVYLDPETNEYRTQRVTAHGRITKLTDEYGNVGNFDFKHRLFRHTSDTDDRKQWFYVFNMNKNTDLVKSTLFNDSQQFIDLHTYMDASLTGLITNNTIYIEPPKINIEGTAETNSQYNHIIFQDRGFIFPDCATHTPHDNIILDSKGMFIINNDFFGNSIKKLYYNDGSDYDFNYSFTNNTIDELYIKGTEIDSEDEVYVEIGDDFDNNKAKIIKSTSILSKVRNSTLGNIDTVQFAANYVIDNLTLYNDETKQYKNIDTSTFTGSITNVTIKGDVTHLTFLQSMTDCLFNGDINNVTIDGILTNCTFQGLSDGLEISGTLTEVEVIDSLTPNSATKVEAANTSDWLPAVPFAVNSTTVPRLSNAGKKTCSLKTLSDNSVAFCVKNSASRMDDTPGGVIVMFSGAVADIPEGWAVCDGELHNGIRTPDLRGRFIRMVSENNGVWESSGWKDNSDLETNGTGTRQAYLKKAIKHTHTFKTYDTNLTANLTNFSIDYVSAHSLGVDTSNLSVSINEQTLTYISYSTAGNNKLIDHIVTDSQSTTFLAAEQNSTDLKHNHTGSISGSATITGDLPRITYSGDITVPINYTPEQATTENGFVEAVNVEPQAYALLFIMKL